MATLSRSLPGALLLFVSLLCASPAAAQSDQEKARELYREGIDLYFAEDFGVAITKFNAGYQLDPNAMFLYSLSLCFSKLGNFAEALDHAQRAKETGGMPDDVATKNDGRLVAFGILVNTEATAAELVEAQKEPEVPTCATNADCSEGEVCNMRRGICVDELPTTPDDEKGRPLFGPLGWAGVGASAVGIGLLVGGGVTSLGVAKNQERFDEVSDPNSDEFDPDERDELLETLENQKNTGRILVLGGAGLTAVGIGLIIVDLLVMKPSSDDEETTRLTPMFLPDGGGISLTIPWP